MSSPEQLDLFGGPETNFQAVGTFMSVMGQQVCKTPAFPALDIIHLRNCLIEEEFDELIEAVMNKDLVGVADALTDILYVVYGAGHAYGIDLDACFREVHRSNMTKISPDGTVLRNALGKVIKPDTYSPPDLAGVISKLNR